MEEKRTLLVGMDIGEQVTQISCFDFTTYEPVAIGRMIHGKREYEIPTALTYVPGSGEWYWIDEMQGDQTGQIRLQHLLLDVAKSDTIEVGMQKLDSYQVLKRYLVKVLSLLTEYYPDEMIKKLVITLDEKEERLVSYLLKIANELGMPKDTLVVQNHKQSYMYYAISQPKELWSNNVGLFELTQKGLWYSQIDINRKREPYIIGVTKKNLTQDLDWDKIGQEEEMLSYAFLNAAQTALHKQYVTTIYVTGKGFEGEWSNEALKELCMGRRIFRGEENAHTRTGSGDSPRAGPGLPCGMLPAISEGLRAALRRAAGSTVHGRTRKPDHARAVCALSDARGVCRRRAGGRRALCALVRVFPRKSAGHRAVRA